ncbi:MAG: FMN-binding protein [Ornithinimicrobium sp.]
MARIIIWLASTVASLVLLFGYPSSTTGATSSAQVGPAIPGMEASAAKNTPTKAAATSYTGDSVSTPYGPVQVQITATDTTVTDVTVLQVPSSNGQDRAINGRAVPELNAQVVDGNAKDVHAVSGASYTSSAYLDSLQSALDQAHL